MSGKKTHRLLARVAARQWADTFLRRFTILSLSLCGAYAALLCTSRLLALIPDRFFLWTLAVPPGLALLLAAAFTWRPALHRTARLLDERSGSKDLYLTTVLIDHSFGDYKPLVLEQAESRAPQIKPDKVAPVRFIQRLLCVAAAAGVLSVGVLYLPQFDPFHKEEARQREATRRKQLEESRTQVALQRENLKKQNVDSLLSKETEEKLEQLKTNLQQAKPDQPKANLETLKQDRKALAEQRAQTLNHQLKDALDRRPVAQQFGQMSAKAGEWKDQLQKGNPEGLRKELADLAEKADKLNKMPEGLEKEKARQELKEGMQQMANFMARQANNAPMNAALNRAMEQLAMAQNKGMQNDAMQALKENLALTDQELQALAQNMRDLQALEEGLKAAAMAQQLNAEGKLNGEDLKDAADYAALYAALMAKMGKNGPGEGEGGGQPGDDGGNGGGMGNRGMGRGGVAPEDDAQKTAYKPDQANSNMVPGKILMQWKTQELTDPGKARELYLAGLEQAKQQASEALVKEEVPPGYHEAISKYFNDLGETIDKPAQP